MEFLVAGGSDFGILSFSAVFAEIYKRSNNAYSDINKSTLFFIPFKMANQVDISQNSVEILQCLNNFPSGSETDDEPNNEDMYQLNPFEGIT